MLRLLFFSYADVPMAVPTRARAGRMNLEAITNDKICSSGRSGEAESELLMVKSADKLE